MSFLTPDAMAASREEKELVLSALHKVPESYRVPLILYYREEQSTSSVAEALGISEEAVRKRLSRGRKMLQAEMVTVVGSILNRTMPSAVFTMTVAGGIGALCPPSTLAATTLAKAVGEKALLTKATTSAGTLTTLTTMTTSKMTLAAAGIVIVSLTAGYQARNVLRSEAAVVQNHGASPVLAHQVGSAPEKSQLKESFLASEWKRLLEVYGTGPEAMPLIHEAIGEMDSKLHRRALYSALAVEWADVSPDTGSDFYGKKKRQAWESEIFLNEWVRRTGWAAIDSVAEVESSVWNKRMRGFLPELITSLSPHLKERSPAEFAGWFQKVAGKNERWDSNIYGSIVNLSAGNLDYARAAALEMSGPSRLQALTATSAVWAERDGEVALQWAQSELTGADRNEAIRGALMGLAKIDPVAALNGISLVPPGADRGFLMPTPERILSAAAESDFEATVSWLRDHPDAVTKNATGALNTAIRPRLIADFESFLSQAQRNDTLEVLMPAVEGLLLNDAAVACSDIWNWLRAQKEPSELYQKLQQKALSSLAYHEPEVAMEVIEQMNREGDSRQQQEVAMRGLFNAGELLGRIEHLLPKASPEVRSTLLSIGFSQLDYENLSNKQRWIDRIPELRPEDRSAAITSLGSAMMGFDQEEAVSLLGRLDGEPKEDGYQAALKKWSSADDLAALQWLEQQPRGEVRDASIVGFLRSHELYRDPGTCLGFGVEKLMTPHYVVRRGEFILRKMIRNDAEHARALFE